MRVIEIECSDPLELGKFWSGVLKAPIGPGTDGVHIASPGDEHSMSLYLVEERASDRPRNRVRLWLNPMQGSLADEVSRLTGLGAVVIEKRWAMESYSLGVVVMADPEGNEFCIESSDREVSEVVKRLEGDSDGPDGSTAEGLSDRVSESFSGIKR